MNKINTTLFNKIGFNSYLSKKEPVKIFQNLNFLRPRTSFAILRTHPRALSTSTSGCVLHTHIFQVAVSALAKVSATRPLTRNTCVPLPHVLRASGRVLAYDDHYVPEVEKRIKIVKTEAISERELHSKEFIFSEKKFLYRTELEKASFLFSDIGELPFSTHAYSFLKRKGIHKLSTLGGLSYFELLQLLEGDTSVFYEIKRFLFQFSKKK